MKSRDGSAPGLARSTGGVAGPRPQTEDSTGRWRRRRRPDADDARPRAIREAMQTAEIDVARDRRATLMSPIPAFMADSMVRERIRCRAASACDPAATRAPSPSVERTRRVGDSGPSQRRLRTDDAARIRRRRRALAPAGRAAHRRRARRLDAGDLAAAVTAAEAALREADEAPPPGIVEVIEPARPLLTRVFATYVGPTSGLPMLAPRADEIARQRLGGARTGAAASHRWHPHAGGAVRRLRPRARRMPCASSPGSSVPAPSASSERTGRHASASRRVCDSSDR